MPRCCLPTVVEATRAYHVENRPASFRLNNRGKGVTVNISPACQAAIRDERAKFKRLNRFWALVYGVSAATTVAGILLIVSLFWGNNPTSVVGGIATVTSGGGMAWVITQRNRAAKDHEAAKQGLRDDCAGVQTATGGLEAARPDGPVGLDDETISALLSE